MRDHMLQVFDLFEHHIHSISVKDHKRRQFSPKPLIGKTHRISIVVHCLGWPSVLRAFHILVPECPGFSRDRSYSRRPPPAASDVRRTP